MNNSVALQHDFKYCVWLTTDDNQQCLWKEYTNGVKPHLTIKSHLTLENALKLKNEINKSFNQPYDIQLYGDIIYEKTSNFYALYYRAKLNDNVETPYWWPKKNAHVSFYYAYEEISEATIKQVSKTVQVKYATFDKIEIKLCRGHYKTW
jgi:hypothetical protein